MTAEKLKNLIESHLPGAEAMVDDPMNDGAHFTATVVAPQFEGKSLVEQHRMVTAPLKAEFGSNTVHALALKTYTPEKWRAAQGA